jgi:hypothetical protein
VPLDPIVDRIFEEFHKLQPCEQIAGLRKSYETNADNVSNPSVIFVWCGDEYVHFIPVLIDYGLNLSAVFIRNRLLPSPLGSPQSLKAPV